MRNRACLSATHLPRIISLKEACTFITDPVPGPRECRGTGPCEMYFALSRSLSIGTVLIHCCSQQYATIYAQAGLEVCPHPCPTRGDMAWQACNGSMHGNSITYMRCGLPGIMRHRTYAQTSQLSCMCSGRAGKKHKHGSQL